MSFRVIKRKPTGSGAFHSFVFAKKRHGLALRTRERDGEIEKGSYSEKRRILTTLITLTERFSANICW